VEPSAPSAARVVHDTAAVEPSATTAPSRPPPPSSSAAELQPPTPPSSSTPQARCPATTTSQELRTEMALARRTPSPLRAAGLLHLQRSSLDHPRLRALHCRHRHRQRLRLRLHLRQRLVRLGPAVLPRRPRAELRIRYVGPAVLSRRPRAELRIRVRVFVVTSPALRALRARASPAIRALRARALDTSSRAWTQHPRF
jgi:hypothetical protein